MKKEQAARLFTSAAAHYRAGRLAEAAQACREALRLDRYHPGALHLLGMIEYSEGRLDEALTLIRQASTVQPSDAAILNSLAATLRAKGEFEQAVAITQRAIQILPRYANPYNTLGASLTQLARLDEAESILRQAIALRPNFAEAHLNLALILLTRGDFAQGWEEYEWRLRSPELGIWQPLPGSVWNGSDPSGRTILVRCEQGFGDAIQFVRYARDLTQRGARVIVEAPPELKALLGSAPGVTQVIARGETLADFDGQVPIMSLPRIFGTRPRNVPADVPYLAPPSESVEACRARLSHEKRRKIGLVWAGNPQHENHRRRSIPPQMLSQLAEVSNVAWYSLQKSLPDDQSRPHFPMIDFTADLRDFSDTAALLMHLDLVIAADTAVAHLAGALGLPVWLLLPWVPDWRWMLHRDDTPWYPTMRLFRQTRAGDWDGVINRIMGSLAKLAREK